MQPSPSLSEVTLALADVTAGVPNADRRLLQLVHRELKQLAGSKMAAQSPDHTLQPTALVNEAYIRLLGGVERKPEYSDSSHFFTAAAAAMRSILVDYARRRKAAKRGGELVEITLHPELIGAEDPLERVLQVHDVFDRFAAEHPRPARVVELLFFAGLSIDEVAEVLNVSDRTVKRDWRFSRSWLSRELREE